MNEIDFEPWEKELILSAIHTLSEGYAFEIPSFLSFSPLLDLRGTYLSSSLQRTYKALYSEASACSTRDELINLCRKNLRVAQDILVQGANEPLYDMRAQHLWETFISPVTQFLHMVELYPYSESKTSNIFETCWAGTVIARKKHDQKAYEFYGSAQLACCLAQDELGGMINYFGLYRILYSLYEQAFILPRKKVKNPNFRSIEGIKDDQGFAWGLKAVEKDFLRRYVEKDLVTPALQIV